jgi:hypothetical protein
MKSHSFTTTRDDQSAVKIRVLQGESERADENHLLGEFVLSNIPPAPKGEPEIEVSFDIDANGIVSVSARDLATGGEQSITVSATGTLSEAEIEAHHARPRAARAAAKKWTRRGRRTGSARQPGGDPISALLRRAGSCCAEDYEGARALPDGRVLDPSDRAEGYVDLAAQPAGQARLPRSDRRRRPRPKLLVPLDDHPTQLCRRTGFVLSLIDGRTCFDELLSLSGMGPFEALRIFASLLEARIVGVAA